MRKTLLIPLLTLLLVLASPDSGAAASSYASGAADEPGSSTGSASVALGVPDYAFVNDAGLGFGGSNTDVFGPGEATVLTFPSLLYNVAGQADLLISAFVGGTGATDSALVQVEVSSDGVTYQGVGSFDTADGRNPMVYGFPQETGFESVKHFPIDFGTEDLVTHVRLTNLAGTAEGLRLDAVEGLHPHVDSRFAFEMRFERYRADESERFLVRLKNIGRPGGAAIRGYRIGRPPDTAEWMENTDTPALGLDGDMICVTNCVGDADMLPGVASLETEWSLDGVAVAPPGMGLEPGRQVAFERHRNHDIDSGALSYLSGFEFEVYFADGRFHTFDYDVDVLGQGDRGALYQKYTYFGSTPSLSGPRPTDTYEYVPEPSHALLLATGALVLLASHRLGAGRSRG